jgi:hypothetical protein
VGQLVAVGRPPVDPGQSAGAAGATVVAPVIGLVIQVDAVAVVVVVAAEHIRIHGAISRRRTRQ